jgi:hypothetical protein
MAGPRLFTGWMDYSATGEGRTLSAFVGLAHDEAEFRAQLRQGLGEFCGDFMYVAEGLVRNEVTDYLWSPAALAMIERAQGDAGAIRALVQLHVNFS